MKRVLIGGMVLTALGCGSKKTVVEPVAGNLTVSYTGTGTTDGALLLTVTGPVTQVTPLGGYRLASASAGTNTMRVVLTGSLASGDVFRLSVPDVSAVSSYTAKIDAVADRSTFALLATSGYTAVVRK
jgi:hypothetical protein